MSAREEILAAVRAAARDVRPPARPAVPATVDSDGGGPEHAGVLDLFTERVEDYRASVVRCRPEQVEDRIAAALGERSVVVPPGLPWRVDGALVDGSQATGSQATGAVVDGAAGRTLSSAELDRVAAVVSAARVAVATTGSIVLDHAEDQGRRALTLLPDLHVCVVRSDQVVPDVPDALVRLDPSRPTTWISGPSATSDIELSRVEGVHGPRTLVVVLVEPGEDRGPAPR